MSVFRFERADSPVWEVRWREDRVQRSRRFDDPEVARAYDEARRAALELERARAALDAAERGMDALSPAARAWVGHLDD